MKHFVIIFHFLDCMFPGYVSLILYVKTQCSTRHPAAHTSSINCAQSSSTWADNTLGQEQLLLTILILKMSVVVVEVLVSIKERPQQYFSPLGKPYPMIDNIVLLCACAVCCALRLCSPAVYSCFLFPVSCRRGRESALRVDSLTQHTTLYLPLYHSMNMMRAPNEWTINKQPSNFIPPLNTGQYFWSIS